MSDAPIPHVHAAFFDFREATKDLGTLSDGAQIVALKYQLLQALERAAGFQERSRRAESQIDRLQTEALQRAQEHQAFAARVVRDVARARGPCEPPPVAIPEAIAAEARTSPWSADAPP